MPLEEHSTFAQSIEAAVAHHKAGRLNEAEGAYRRILADDARQFDALHLLGVIEHQKGNYRDAIELIAKAIVQDPTAFPALNNLGLAYRAMNELEKARDCFQRAIQLNAEYAEAHNNLGLLFQTMGRFDEAVGEFKKVSLFRPDFAEAHHNLAIALQGNGNPDEAVTSYRRALALNPERAETHFLLARALESEGKTADALAEYQDALILKPEMAEAHFHLGSILQDQGMLKDALDCFRTAFSLKPSYAEAHWAHAMSQLALVFEADDDHRNYTRAFSNGLEKLDKWFDSEHIKDGHKAVGSQQPFFLAYVEQNNLALLSKYGDLCRRLMAYWQTQQGVTVAVPARNGKLRLGIISAHIHDQSVWTAIVRGWCQHLDADRISLYIFHTGAPKDEETAYARSRATYFTQGARELQAWVHAIVEQNLDAIIYPEIGMDPTTARLANLRLAPIQIAAWGHPETSGFATIDYYLSAENFEPYGAQENYREKLVTLPNLGCTYTPLNVRATKLDLDALGLDTDCPLLICAGTPMKYPPARDAVLVKIARELGRCKFVFFNHFKENLSEKVQLRLDAAFLDADMYFSEYAVYLPWLKRPAFFGLMQSAHVYLDTIGFSGFNTAMQAIECGLPIVAWDGKFMRGRLASGILRRINLSELVAHSESEYVDIAVRLARDDIYRRSIREQIAASRDALFDDLAPVRALEVFLQHVTADGRRRGSE